MPEKEIRDAFAEGWAVESIEPTQIEARTDWKDIAFSNGGLRAWIVVVRQEGTKCPRRSINPVVNSRNRIVKRILVPPHECKNPLDCSSGFVSN